MTKCSIEAWSIKGGGHENNEDAVLVGEELGQMDNVCWSLDIDSEQACVVGVADGIGGQIGGARASVHVLAEFKRLAALGASVSEFCVELSRVGLVFNGIAKSYAPGAAVACLLIQREHMHCLWAGDCRIWVLSTDGRIVFESPEDAVDICGKRIITNAIGGGVPSGGNLHVWRIPIDSGRVTLCTDGARSIIEEGRVVSFDKVRGLILGDDASLINVDFLR